jgi:aminobenzoyl-glutamate utilization protein A
MATITDWSLSELRRDLHAYPEAGWKEFRTTALVAEALEERGYTIHIGHDALDFDSRLGVPDEDEIHRAKERGRDEGAPEAYLDRMGSVTGLVAEKTFGDRKQPVVGVRVDMDALEITESSDPEHRPTAEGFASKHPNEMHACGHDGHTTIGVGIARELDSCADFSGTVRLFFQPAEEGGRGGLPMSQTAHFDGIECFVALHLGLDNETGTVVAGYERPLSNAKVDVEYRGESAHAGKAPNEGKNALQAATTAMQNLYGIPRHADGATRINVGHLHSPNVQNAISDTTRFRIEVRGETGGLNEYMLDKAHRITEHAAKMHEVEYETSLYGKTTSFEADEALVNTVSESAATLDSVTNVIGKKRLAVSEDASYLLNRVQEEGGQATFIGIGASNPSGHHTSRFDIEEDALEIGVDVVVETLRNLSQKAVE